MITYNDINALPTSGVSLTIITKDGIQTFSYECHTSTTLADIINGTIEAMQPGDRIVSIAVG